MTYDDSRSFGSSDAEYLVNDENDANENYCTWCPVSGQ